VLETGGKELKINDECDGECFGDIEPRQPFHRPRLAARRSIGKNAGVLRDFSRALGRGGAPPAPDDAGRCSYQPGHEIYLAFVMTAVK
jgi:hypothetical protein